MRKAENMLNSLNDKQISGKVVEHQLIHPNKYVTDKEQCPMEFYKLCYHNDLR